MHGRHCTKLSLRYTPFETEDNAPACLSMYLLFYDGNKNAYSSQSPACNTTASAWHARSASRFNVWRETRPDHTACPSGDVTQASLQAEQHRPASCLPAQACSRHASDCKCTHCCISGGEQACQSVPLEVSAGGSCSGSGASGE